MCPELIRAAFVCCFIAGLNYAAAAGNTDLGPNFVNVRLAPYAVPPNSGVVTCTTDATTLIQNALTDVGNAGGGVVFLPAGIYCIATHLVVPTNTTLKGVLESPAVGTFGASSIGRGTTLLAFENSNVPFITLTGATAVTSVGGAVLDGLTIYYPNQVLPAAGAQWAPVVYPYSIRGEGDTTIQNVMLVNSYQGIDLYTTTSGRHIVNNVFGQPLFIGIRVDQSYDVGRISNVHFWRFWSAGFPGDSVVANWVQHNATAFIFGHADWEMVRDIFAYGYNIGMNFGDSGHGVSSGEFSNISFDSTGVGLDLYATALAGIHFTNLTVANVDPSLPNLAIWNHNAGNSSNVSVVNGTSFGNVAQAVLWEQEGLLTLSSFRVETIRSGTPAIAIRKGNAMIQNCAFTDGKAGTPDVSVTSSGKVIITGNLLYGGSLAYPITTMAANNLP